MRSDNFEDEPDLEINKEYLKGLLDYLIRPKLEPYPTKGGYGLQTSLTITLRQSEIIAGLVFDALEALNVQSRVDYTEGNPKEIIVEDSNSIERIRDFGSGSFIQVAEKLAYLEHIHEEYAGANLSATPERFLEIYKPWAGLHPEWGNHKSRKYTVDFFKNEFNIHSISEPDPVPDVEYPDKMSKPYVSGLFDATGRLRLSVSKNNEYNLGFVMNPGVHIQISNPDILVGAHLKKFFQGKEMNPSIHSEEDFVRLTISGIDEIAKFLETIGEYIFYNYEMCELFHEQILPALDEGYHHTKEGFYDILQVSEEFDHSNREKKYDAKYFESKWDI